MHLFHARIAYDLNPRAEFANDVGYLMLCNKEDGSLNWFERAVEWSSVVAEAEKDNSGSIDSKPLYEYNRAVALALSGEPVEARSILEAYLSKYEGADVIRRAVCLMILVRDESEGISIEEVLDNPSPTECAQKSLEMLNAFVTRLSVSE